MTPTHVYHGSRDTLLRKFRALDPRHCPGRLVLVAWAKGGRLVPDNCHSALDARAALAHYRCAFPGVQTVALS